MKVVGIYCEECNRLIGARDESTGETEYAATWCGRSTVNKCWGCFDPFNIPILEDDDEQPTG